MEPVILSEVSLNPNQLAVLSQDLLAAGYQVRFRAHGESMAPTVRDGDVLVVAPISLNRIRRGDIVLVVSGNGRAQVHRVVKLGTEGSTELVQTCGDNASVKDRPVVSRQIIGKIIEINRDGKRINQSGLLHELRRIWNLIRASRVPSFDDKDGKSL